MNGDGNLDLVFTCQTYLLGMGDGTFVKAGEMDTAQDATLRPHDLDGDGVSE